MYVHYTYIDYVYLYANVPNWTIWSWKSLKIFQNAPKWNASVQSIYPVNVFFFSYRRQNNVALHIFSLAIFFKGKFFFIKMKTNRQINNNNKEAKQKTNKRYQNLKNNKQKSENKIISNLKKNVYPLTRATLIKNDFMTLISFGVIFGQAKIEKLQSHDINNK